MNGDLLALGAVAALAAAGAARQGRGSLATKPPVPLPHIDVSLECLCADDFGAGYKPRSRWTRADQAHTQQYEETRENQHFAKQLIEESGLGVVDVLQTDDRDSQHSDCYVRFDLADLPRVASLLQEAGLGGDVLDGADDIGPILKQWIESTYFWKLE